MEAARRRFLSDGVDGASLRQIARDAGTSIGMIYYYFPTKDDLFFGVVEETYGKLLADLEQALDRELPVKERIRRMSARLSRVTEKELEVVRVVVREALSSSARLARLIERFKRGHLALVLSTVGDGIARGELDASRHPALLMMATFAITGAPHLMRRVLGSQHPFAELPEGEALADQLVDILFSGVGKKGESR